MGESAALRAAERSAACVMAKDKAAWLALFAADACIEDPVGVSAIDPTGNGHTGSAAIEAFWDANIGPNEFVFNIRETLVPADGSEVCRVGQIVTRVAAFEMTSVTNGVFIYRVNKDGKLASLRAFYDFRKMAQSCVPFPKL